MTAINTITSDYIKQLSDQFGSSYHQKTGIDIMSEETDINQMQDFLDDCLDESWMAEVSFMASNDALNLSQNQMFSQLPRQLMITPINLYQKIKEAADNRDESVVMPYYRDKFSDRILSLRLLHHSADDYQIVYALCSDDNDGDQWHLLDGYYDGSGYAKYSSPNFWDLAHELINICIDDIDQ